MLNRKLLLLVILTTIFSATLADLPVHCLKHQIIGRWALQLTNPQKVASGHEMKCGHDEPDSAQTSNKAMKGEFAPASSVEVLLDSDDSVEVKSGGSGAGKWTMVYDEGFEIRVDSTRYFAFSKYNDNGLSDCSKTLVGWYHNTNTGDWGCYKGKKIFAAGETKSDHINKEVKHEYVVQPKETFTSATSNSTPETTSKLISAEDDDISMPDLQKLISEDDDETPTNTGGFLAPSLMELHSEFKEHHRFVERFNKIEGKQWHAEVHDEWSGMSIKQLNRRAGRKKYNSASFSLLQTQARAAARSGLTKKTNGDLPKDFDWKQMLGDVYQQRDCGSCYAIATMGMLQARLKKSYSEDVKLSVQHVLDCSYYNQGCDGGYPFLAEKFASEFELVPETCHPYKASNGECSNSCDVKSLPKTYKVKDYWFVGGSYGKANEQDMMSEIMKNGPIVVSFEPAYDFMMYKSGIYHSVDQAEWKKRGLPKPEWEKVDHSVLCYGWGEENGEKYWKLMNSWGPAWGEDGFFRMRRGTDESSIESLAEAANPYVVERSSVSFVETPNEDNSDSFRAMLRTNDDDSE